MNCVITNGACYIKRSSENLLVATDSLGDAFLFPAEKAQATITCLPKALQDKGFKVKKCLRDSWTYRIDRDGRGWKS